VAYDEVAPNAGLLPYRVGQLESFRRDLEEWRKGVDKDRTAIEYIQKDVRTIKTLLVGAIVSLLGSSVSICAAILLATGHFS
jgi:hypothetical protein